MDQTSTLTTGWEPDTPLDDSIVRQVVFAYADRVAWMARATGGRVDRDHAACIADVGSAFGYDNAAVLLQPPDAAGLAGVLARADRLFAPQRWWIVLSAWPLPRDLPEGLALVGHPPLMLRPPGPFGVARPAGLRICRVEDGRWLVDFDAVLKAGFPLPGGAGSPTSGYSDTTCDCSSATTAINRSPPPECARPAGSSRWTGSPPFPPTATRASGRP